jgi:hypothetical protein
MMKNRFALFSTALVLVGALSTTAEAQSVSGGIYYGPPTPIYPGPVYVEPQPAYVYPPAYYPAPAPAYVYAPAPAYYYPPPPPPVYYAEPAYLVPGISATFVFGGGKGHGWGGHH